MASVQPKARPHHRAKLTILHTNDVHGHFWRNEAGKYGFAAQRSLIEKIKKEVHDKGGDVLVVSAGDINTGAPASDVFEAEPDIRAMNLMGYSAMALGNHEFDHPRAVLRHQVMKANFPFLSANIYRKGTREHAFPSYVIREISGLKVALVGLTTEDTPALAGQAAGLDFHPAIEEAKRLLPRLKKKADLVVVLSHLGYYPKGEHGSNAPGDVELATQTTGADVIIGGHTHTEMTQPDEENGTLIVQAGCHGKFLGRLDLEVEDGRVVGHDYHLLPVEGSEDPEMLALLAPYEDAADRALKSPLSRVEGAFFGKDAGVEKETNLGRLIARAQRKAVNADVGIVNHGGIRASFGPGSINQQKVLEIQPFSNTLCTVDLTGRELKEYLEAVGKRAKRKTLHMDGVRVFHRHGDIEAIEIDGKPVDLASSKRYRVVVNSHSALKGDGWPDLSLVKGFRNTLIPDAVAFKRFLEKAKLIRAADYETSSMVDLDAMNQGTDAESSLFDREAGAPRSEVAERATGDGTLASQATAAKPAQSLWALSGP
ncbi:MAG: 5'-nucleotidase C-terminal domain-containing protein [Deltaproteobacteria bacterium]|nr:5'-nucleotidase C-terminal domain-containing protein [Deltaproteobacteria bacterium]